MNDFKSKALESTFWSFFETFGNQGLQFLIGIILARLLLPEDYGIVGVLAIFMGIAGVLVDSGFKTSIIRSKDITAIDCSTIFYVNLVVSIVVAILLFASATSIAFLFGKPELVNITRVFALIPLINGFGLVQTALQYKNLKFKRNAIISITTNLVAGLLSIYMAYNGFSYWALIWRAILSAVLYNSLIWITSSWRPQLIFSIEILKKHFRFSSRLLFTGMIDSFFENIYSFIFGRFFSFKELGFFTRGKGYVTMITKTLSVTIQKVNTPLMAISGKNDESKINAYLKLLRGTLLLIFPATIILVATAKPMIVFLIGEKWLPAVPYLQILALSGMIYPILNANSSFFEVIGRSDLILRLSLISRPIQILILLVTLKFNAIMVAWGIVIHYLIVFSISIYFMQIVTYTQILKLIKVLFLPLTIAVLLGILIGLFGFFTQSVFSSGFQFLFRSILGVFITLLLFYFFKIDELNLVKDIMNKLFITIKVKLLKIKGDTI